MQQQQQDTQQSQAQTSTIIQVQTQQQDTQQVNTQSSTSIVKLLPPPQQEQQQTQSQIIAGIGQPQQSIYVAPQQQDTQTTQVPVLKPPVQNIIETPQQSMSGTGITVSRNLFAYNPLTSTNSSNMELPVTTYIEQPKLSTSQIEVETTQYQIASFNGISKAGNPLSEILMQQRFEMMQNNIAQPTSSVNKNTVPNELAGAIDIALIANVPAGFNAYSFVLKDAAFYESKEVYKNQQTVDNVKLLRGLTGGSDIKHQEMVNQQYKLGE
jgi:hypothetical protein